MGAKTILTGLALAFCLASGVSHATVVTGNTVQSINGYEGYVDVFDQATVNLVSGADVAWLNMHEQSNLNFLAGEASWIDMYDNSHADVRGGDLSWLSMYDNSRANIFQGTLSWLLMFEASAANIYRSDISWLVLDRSSRADIYGSNFAYSSGHLSGNWADGTPFSFWALKGDAQGVSAGFGPSSLMPANIFLHVVPAPATPYLIILALPLLALFRGKRLAKRPSPV